MGLHQSPRLFLNLHHDPLAHQQIEDTSESQWHERTADDNDVIRHAEIWGGEVDKKCRDINPLPIITRKVS